MPYSNIDKPSKYFNPITYSGSASTQTISGVGFQPDWTWIKVRNQAYSHQLYDVVRGVGYSLYSNDTSAEGYSSTNLTAFTSDGFTVYGGSGGVNASGNTYVSWNWKANGAGVSNTQGTITSTVSVNTTSGFSIVSYTGNGTGGATVGHGLGVAPSMIIVKRRTNSGAYDWVVYHKNKTAGLYLNSTGFNNDSSANSIWFNGTAPTSSVFSLGTDGRINGSTQTYIAYCFADVKGFSKFGSYTGNGNADGTFVYTGFKPAFVMIKRTDSAGTNWNIIDNKRNTFNVTGNYLSANTSNAENSDGLANYYDFLSNGFKIRNSGSFINASGGTYIYMAFAESPFCSSKGIPTTAR